ncbi:MAG: hypothetical protein Kow0098_06420 [Ignavibacteriaceae bacterium]
MAQKKIVNQKKDSGQSSKTKKNNFSVVVFIVIIAVAGYYVINNLTGNNEVEEYYHFKKEGELIFTDSTGNSKIKIDIEIADNEYERQLGLMKRKEMEEKQGMLFIFPQERMQSFWMRNTLISLDMIFVNADKKIVTIHKNTETLSDKSYPSTAPAKYVIEVVAGFTDKFNINEGDKVNWMATRINLNE